MYAVAARAGFHKRTAMTNLYTRIFALGAISGARSMLGPALVAGRASEGARTAFRLLSLGEMVGDKLPKTPSRLDVGPLIGRAAAGAGVGYVLCRRAGEEPWLGAALGTLAAMLGAYATYHARKTLGKTLHVPDALLAVGEDALMLSIGRRFAQ